MNTPIFHLDLETYSPLDLKKVGAFKYAAHPEARILVMSIARGDAPPLAWSELYPNPDALMLLAEAVATGAEIWAHNAQFEFAMFQAMGERTFRCVPDPAQWRCTMALCRLAAIPGSLEDAGAFLAIDLPKDTEGGRLIDRFCSPRKPTKADPRPVIRPEDDPGNFYHFVEYCRRDVMAERQIHQRIKLINQETPGQAIYLADLRMNERGIPVNLTALANAAAMITDYSAGLVPRFRKQVESPGEFVELPVTTQRKAPKRVSLEEGFNPGQREMMVAFLRERGFTGGDLQATTVERWLEEPLASQLTPAAREALHTYSLVTSAAVKKIPAMLERAGADGYVRGALLIFGAERTHRWTGKGIQPQNFARPTIKFTELAYEAICAGWSWQDIELVFGDLYQVLASCIRHFIQPHPDPLTGEPAEVLQADYSAIEARVAPWLCNEEETLQLFRQNAPVYERMASLIFGKPVEEVTKEERFVGKQAVLGCSYNMGRPKFRATCANYGYAPSPEMVEGYKLRHHAFTTAAMRKTEREIARRFEKKGLPVPDKCRTAGYLAERTCADNGWPNLNPTTFEEWQHFAYDELADRAVTAWRAANPKIVSMWRELDVAAKCAINASGAFFDAGKIRFMFLEKEMLGFACLGMRLPSGHYLIYPNASVVPNESKGWGTQIRFWGVLPNSGGQWGWCYTYGGKLLENATQAAAGDVMREGVLAAERAGYQPFMLVHDEILCTRAPGQTHEELCRLLCTMPAWAAGLPLAAEGSTIPFYKK